MGPPVTKINDVESTKLRVDSQAVSLLSQQNQPPLQPVLVNPVNPKVPISSQAAKKISDDLANAVKEKNSAAFVRTYNTNTAPQPPGAAEREFARWRDLFLQIRDPLHVKATADAANQGKVQERDQYLSILKTDASERASLGESDATGKPKSTKDIEISMLHDVGQQIRDSTVREDMLRAAHEVGFSSEAIRGAGTLLNVLPAFLNDLVGPAAAMQEQTLHIQNTIREMKETTDAAERERQEKELEKLLDRIGITDPEAKKEIVDSAADSDTDVSQTMDLVARASYRVHYPMKAVLVPMIGKFSEDSEARTRIKQEKLLNTDADARLADVDKIKEAKAKVAKRAGMDQDPVFHDKVEHHLPAELETNFKKAVPIRVDGGQTRRDPMDLSTYNPIPQGGLLSAYRKAVQDYLDSAQA